MNWIDSVVPWAVPKKIKWVVYIRIVLGTFIVYKGVFFILNVQYLFDSLNTVPSTLLNSSVETFSQNITGQQVTLDTMAVIFVSLLSTYVTTAHLIGGALLVLGLYTRWVCLIQIPILLSAILIVYLPNITLSIADYLELGTAIIVFFGLVFFIVMGAGVKSIDELRRRDLQQIVGTKI